MVDVVVSCGYTCHVFMTSHIVLYIKEPGLLLILGLTQLTPSFFFKFSRALLCLWCSSVDDVTNIGVRRAVIWSVEWHRSLKMALLMALQRSTSLLFSLRLTEKQGTKVSGPISWRNAMASLSWVWSQKWQIIWFKIRNKLFVKKLVQTWPEIHMWHIFHLRSY